MSMRGSHIGRGNKRPTCHRHVILKEWVKDSHKSCGGRWRCRECYSEYMRRYRKENGESLALKDRDRRAKYRRDHKDVIAAYARIYMPKYREENSALLREKRQSPEGQVRLRSNRARRDSRKNSLCCEECEGYGYGDFATGKCYICLSRDADTTDHVMPLSLGGMHCVLNFKGACMKCNKSKGNRFFPGHEGWESFLNSRRGE